MPALLSSDFSFSRWPSRMKTVDVLRHDRGEPVGSFELDGSVVSSVRLGGTKRRPSLQLLIPILVTGRL